MQGPGPSPCSLHLPLQQVCGWPAAKLCSHCDTRSLSTETANTGVWNQSCWTRPVTSHMCHIYWTGLNMQVRAYKKAVTQYKMRAELKALVSIMRKSRFKNSSDRILEIIIWCKDLSLKYITIRVKSHTPPRCPLPTGCAENSKNLGLHWWISGLWCVMILLMGIQRRKSEFQTASQSEIVFKMAKRSKYGDFNFVVEYSTWVSIKRTLTGKLAVDYQNFIYCVQFQENFQKP